MQLGRGSGRARRVLSALLCASLALLLLPVAPAGAARKDKDKDSKNESKYVLNKRDAKNLAEAQELLQAEDWAGARKILDDYDLEREREQNPYVYSVVNLALGLIEANTDDYTNAAVHFAAALSTGTLPPAQQLSTRFNLGQIYIMLDEWDKAVATLEKWFEEAEKPQPDAYYMLAVAHYQNDERDAALEPARKAVETSDNPREVWMQLLLSIYLEQRNYTEALPLLEQMVLRYDKADYWARLAAVLNELERDDDSLAAQQLAYAKGFLDNDRALIRLAQTYAFNSMPWQGAEVMKDALENDKVKSDAQSWRLYANSLLAAREMQMALEPLEKAAELSEDGEVYIQLSQVYIQNERWLDALAALDHAFAKGDLQNPGHAYLLMGIAAYQVKRVGEARRSFARAMDHEQSRDMAERWLQFVDREQAAQAG